MKNLFLCVLLVASASANTQASTHVDSRGYGECEARLNAELAGTGLAVDRQYFVKHAPDSRTYFINGHIWSSDNERTAVRATCATSANGRKVQSLTTDAGSFLLQEGVLATR